MVTAKVEARQGVTWQSADGRTQLVQTERHKTDLKTAPKITKSKITTLHPVDGIVVEVLNKACPVCGSSLWWSRVPTKGSPETWGVTDFEWKCVLGEPPKWKSPIVTEDSGPAVNASPPVKAVLCRICGKNPVRKDRPSCMGMCFVCTVKHKDAMREHATDCLRCRDAYFRGWRNRALEKIYG